MRNQKPPMSPLDKFFVALSGFLIVALLFWASANKARAADFATDYNNVEVSDQISAEAIAKAKAEWIEENGEWQPNLDADTEKYLRKTTALLQEQRNAKSKTR